MHKTKLIRENGDEMLMSALLAASNDPDKVAWKNCFKNVRFVVSMKSEGARLASVWKHRETEVYYFLRPPIAVLPRPPFSTMFPLLFQPLSPLFFRAPFFPLRPLTPFRIPRPTLGLRLGRSLLQGAEPWS